MFLTGHISKLTQLVLKVNYDLNILQIFSTCPPSGHIQPSADVLVTIGRCDMYLFMYYCVEGTFVIGWAPWGRSGWVGSFKSGCLPPVVSSGKATLDSSSSRRRQRRRRRQTEETSPGAHHKVWGCGGHTSRNSTSGLCHILTITLLNVAWKNLHNEKGHKSESDVRLYENALRNA